LSCPKFRDYPIGKVWLKVPKIVHVEPSSKVISLHIEKQQIKSRNAANHGYFNINKRGSLF